MSKQRSALQKRLATLRRWAEGANKRKHQASKRQDRLQAQREKRADELYRELDGDLATLQMHDLPDDFFVRLLKRRQSVIDKELKQIRAKEKRAGEQYHDESRKQEHYCKEQRDVLRVLGDLDAKERTMYELDNRKDQVMTVCKVAMANLAMWVRDQYVPASYAHATWPRLVPFFRLPGPVRSDATTVRVEFRPFTDRALNRDLTSLCERVNEASPRLPDGRRLCFTLSLPCRILPALSPQVA